MPISGELYRKIGRAAAGAVSVVCSDNQWRDGVAALTVSSFVTLSFAPPLVMFAIQQSADSFSSMVGSKMFGVSLLCLEQSDIARRFARKGVEKLMGFEFHRGSSLPVPLIPGALVHIECLTHETFISGDHAIVVGLVERASQPFDGNPLLFFAQKYGAFVPLTES